MDGTWKAGPVCTVPGRLWEAGPLELRDRTETGAAAALTTIPHTPTFLLLPFPPPPFPSFPAPTPLDVALARDAA